MSRMSRHPKLRINTGRNSRKREVFARTAFLKGLRKAIAPEDIVSVYLVGSAQRKVRDSGLLSDLDIVVVVPSKAKEEKYTKMKKGLTKFNLLRAKAWLHGIIKVDVRFYTPEKARRRRRERPVQLIAGKEIFR
jgi:predicted nucleotidyltransferase